MKNIAVVLALLACQLHAWPALAQQHVCGGEVLLRNMQMQDPARLDRVRALRDEMVQQAMSQPADQAKTAVLSPIPLVFHFVLTQDKYILLGGDDGIKKRVYSQIASLNKDYSGTNADRSKVPAVWAGLVDEVGATFGLATASSSSTISPGIEVRIVTRPPNYDVNDGCAAAKHVADGLPAWDVDKYLNIWVTNIFGGGSNGVILGVTIPPSFTTPFIGFPSNEKGIVVNYGAVGARTSPNQYFIGGIDQGRTLTHEMGHYFELRHIWGDDQGKCPTTGGQDDGITDTPPQADATYCSSGTCPTFPKLDACSPSGNGIMFMNYMDYVDDAAMFMFTKKQGIMMRSQFGLPSGPSYSLTQNPGLATLATREIAAALPGWHLWPNPAAARVQMSLERAEGFRGMEITSLTGQVVARIAPKAGALSYDIDLSAAPRGFYIVRCLFDAGTQSKKLVLE
jgi:hypothetical protein